MTTVQLTRAQLHAWRWGRQGLDGSLDGAAPAAVFDRVGWARSIGGGNPYVTLHSRAGIGRAEAERAAADLEIFELPVVRGCTYVLGADDFAWGLALGAPHAEAEVKTVAKLGVPRSELEALADAVVDALGDDERTPAELREALGDRVRSLGEAGKKKGSSTTLPAALGLLQADGRIRRVPIDGRLDVQRYRYRTWGLTTSTEDRATLEQRIVERLLRWTGGATIAQSRWFTGLPLGKTKAALAAAGAESAVVAVDGRDPEEWFLLPGDVDALAAVTPPDAPRVRLLAGNDGLVLLGRNAADAFTDEDRAHPLAMGGANALLADLADHPIVDRGRIVGVWQFDHEAGAIAWTTFAPASEAVEAEVAAMAAWIRDDLGDFRSFSLDSPKSRRTRIDAILADERGRITAG